MRLLATYSLLGILIITSACSVSGVDNEEKLSMDLETEFKTLDYLPNQSITLTVTNVSNQELEYNFPTSCQSGYTLKHNSEIILDSSSAVGCLTALSSFKLASKEKKQFTFRFAPLSEYLVDMPEGTYEISAFLLNDNSKSVSTTFELK